MRPASNKLVPVLLFLAILLSFSGALRSPFQWDDGTAITRNESIRDLSNVPSFLTSVKTFSADGEKDIYRPLRTAIRALEYRAWGLDPAGYHAVNLIFHFGATWLLHGITLLLSGSGFTAVLCALLFALAPAHVESVTYISGGDDCVSGFFFLSALLVYAKRRIEGDAPFSLGLKVPALFVLALLAKEMSITFPFLVFLLDYYFFSNNGSLASRAKSVYLPLLALAAAYFLARGLIVGSVTQIHYGAFGGAYPLFCTMAVGLAYYVKLLVLPINLCVDYMAFPRFFSLLHPMVLFSLSVLFFLFFVVYKLRDALPLASFGLAFFLIALLPVSQILPVKILIAERFLYIPSAGFFLFAAAVLGMAREKIPARRVLLTSFLALLFLFNGCLAFYRNSVWTSDLDLWADAVKKYPANSRAHSNLGTAYLTRGNRTRAIIEYEKSLDSLSSGGTDWNNLGVIYAEMGLYEKALEKFKLEQKNSPSAYARKMAGENIRMLKEKIGSAKKIRDQE
ncbi:MAG: tetratricopeptide repeat protein [Nitrospinae bacterium]|nr:tetratricopeptide repeat protein [Nitrospinota bacterium]